MKTEQIYLDDYGEKWLQPYQLAKQYSINRVTVWRLLNEMRTNPKFKNSILDLNQRLHLIRSRDFLEFLQSRNKKYLKA